MLKESEIRRFRAIQKATAEKKEVVAREKQLKVLSSEFEVQLQR